MTNFEAWCNFTVKEKGSILCKLESENGIELYETYEQYLRENTYYPMNICYHVWKNEKTWDSYTDYRTAYKRWENLKNGVVE